MLRASQHEPKRLRLETFITLWAYGLPAGGETIAKPSIESRRAVMTGIVRTMRASPAAASTATVSIHLEGN